MIEIVLTQFFVLMYKCYFILLFLVNLHFEFSIFISLRSLFHSVQNLVPIELAAFFPQRIELCTFFSTALIAGRQQIQLYLLSFPCYENH